MHTEATPLARKLAARIRRERAITFRDFMQSALYDPEHGYYNTERLKIGAGGDYYTSSNVHPAFGAVLARSFVELWREAIGEPLPSPLVIVEMGAGTGQLAFDLLAALGDEHTNHFARLSYVIVETSPAMRERQREKLSRFRERVSWREIAELERGPVTGIFFSNELVDAMPVHVVRFARQSLEEMYVTLDEAASLQVSWDRPSTAELTDYVERLNVKPGEGQVMEINLAALDWLARLSRAINRGLLVTIDYGDVAAHLYAADRSGGTLRSFYQHHLACSPLERVGEQDITASVNFTALIERGRDLGFETVSYERQVSFLIRMGLIERIAAMENAGGAANSLNERLAVKNLFVPGGVSDNFRVLVQKKN
jgi:SAM-dependent MidA family methyltransferase